MNRVSKAIATVCIGTTVAFAPTRSSAFTIQFVELGGWFSADSNRMDRLNDAGAFFEGIIGDDLDAITPGGGNSWTTDFVDPSNGLPAFLSQPSLVNNPSIPADTIVVYVGARGLGGPLGIGAPGGVGGYTPGVGSAWETTIFTRGESGATTGGSATDFAPWGGSLAVDSGANWDYSLDDSTLDPGEFHFYSLLLHELAHVLGVGDGLSDSWDANVIAGEFTGAAAFAANGDANVTLEPGNTHWVGGTTSAIWDTGGSQEAAMTPVLGSDETKLFTDLDVAALEDIGWEIIPPVPEPGAGVLAGLAALGLLFRRRR